MWKSFNKFSCFLTLLVFFLRPMQVRGFWHWRNWPSSLSISTSPSLLSTRHRGSFSQIIEYTHPSIFDRNFSCTQEGGAAGYPDSSITVSWAENQRNHMWLVGLRGFPSLASIMSCLWGHFVLVVAHEPTPPCFHQSSLSLSHRSSPSPSVCPTRWPHRMNDPLQKGA